MLVLGVILYCRDDSKLTNRFLSSTEELFDMELAEYLNADEEIRAEAPVYGDPHALFFSGKSGKIGCTDTRILFSGKRTMTAINLADISTVQYQEPTWSRAYLYSGLASLAYSLFNWNSASGIAILTLLIGSVLLLTGYWLRKSQLSIHTRTEVHEFISRGESLEQIARLSRSQSE